MDPTETHTSLEEDSEIEIDTYIDSEEDCEEGDRITDQDLNIDSTEAAHFEQLPSTKTNVKCSSVSDLKNIGSNTFVHAVNAMKQ